MPGTTLPSIPHYEHGAPTSVDLEYADLAVIDLSKASTAEGRAELAPQVRDAMRTHGFLYVINHGFSQAQNERIFDVADVPFSQVSEQEKKAYVGAPKDTGVYQGYKLRQYWHISGGVRDQVEHYSVDRALNADAHPEALRPLLPEVQAFAEHNHYKVLHPILRLLALGMELPEETFVNIHGMTSAGKTFVRFMKYYPRSDEEEEKTKEVWLKGHTDIGSMTILWSQPVGGLQILSPDGKWRWLRHIPNALVINAGDAMEFLSGGFYKATIHRVVQPPADQRGMTRLGAFYFAMADDGVRLRPFAESPALQRVGVVRRCADADAPTMLEWRQARTKSYGQVDLVRKNDAVEEELVGGVVVNHYN